MLVTIMVDASWCQETKMAGYSAWLASDRLRTRFDGFINQQVSQAMVAEAMAIVNAIVAAMTNGVAKQGDTILVRTDCQAAIQLFEKRRTPKVGDDLLTLKVFNMKVERFGISVRFKHIKGHTDSKDRAALSNNACDKRAKEQLQIARNLYKLNEIRKRCNL